MLIPALCQIPEYRILCSQNWLSFVLSFTDMLSLLGMVVTLSRRISLGCNKASRYPLWLLPPQLWKNDPYYFLTSSCCDYCLLLYFFPHLDFRPFVPSCSLSNFMKPLSATWFYVIREEPRMCHRDNSIVLKISLREASMLTYKYIVIYK